MVNKTAERVGERTRHTKHFDSDMPGQFVAEITTGPQHFIHKDTSLWTELDQLVEDVTGGFGSVAADVQVEVANGWITFTRNGSGFRIQPKALWLVDTTDPATRRHKVADADMSDILRDGRRARARNIFPGIHLDIDIHDRGMRKRWVMPADPNLPDPTPFGWNAATTQILFVWELDQTGGITARNATTLESVVGGYWEHGTLEVRDSLDETLMFMHAAERWEQDDPTTVVPVPYGFIANLGLCETMPYGDYLTVAFPYVIDPSTDIEIAASGDDGYIARHTGGTVDFSVNTAYAEDRAGYRTSSALVYRHYHRFDLSSLSGYTCDSANLNLVSVSGTTYTVGTDVIYPWHCSTPWTPSLAYSDWGCGDTRQGSGIQIQNLNADNSTYDVFDLEASDVEGDFGGWCAFETGTSRTSGANDEFGRFRTWDSVDAGDEPYLSIVYSAGVTPGVTFNFTTNKVTVIGGSPP